MFFMYTNQLQGSFDVVNKLKKYIIWNMAGSAKVFDWYL